MLGTYIRTAFRSLARNKGYAFINVLGLSLGITFALMIYLIISFEMSFDTFHSKFNRIYRIDSSIRSADGVDYDMGSQAPLADALRRDFPDLERVTVCNYRGEGLVAIDGTGGNRRKFQEKEGIAYLEPEFFDIFDFAWVAGTPRSSLAAPYTAALTADAARKYFGDENPIGRVIRLDNEIDLTVTGILREIPRNSDFPFSVIISYATLTARGKDPGGRVLNNWNHTASDVNTFVLLAPGGNAAHFESLLPAFLQRYYDNSGPTTRLYTVQPLATIHHDPRFGNYGRRTSSFATLWSLGIIGVLLILTACINFINIATAQSLQRAKEVGVRKVLGGNRTQIVLQFMIETFAITVVAVALSLVMAELLFPSLITVLELHLDPAVLTGAPALAFLFVMLIAVTCCSGFYPAIVLSGFKPVLALSRRITSSHAGGLGLRKGLVVVQFAITQVLVIGTIVVARQMDYCLTRDLGFEREAVVTVPLPSPERERRERFRDGLLDRPGIRNVSFDLAPPASDDHWTSGFKYNDGKEVREIRADLKWGNEEYIPAYGLRLIAGRNFARSDTLREFVINEAAMKKMGIADPREAVGKTITYGANRECPVVGVVSDFTPGSLHDGVTPCLLGTSAGGYRESSIKLTGTDTRGTVRAIERAWDGAFPEYVFEYRFVNERIDDFYRQDSQVSVLIDIFAGVAVLIGAIGLFGLVSFVAARRTKEIGVRKVLGATAADILLMFGREFSLLIIVAFGVAAPVATVAMNRWLDDFAFRIGIGPAIYLVALAITGGIAAATIAYRAIRSSLTNPVESLRYE